jgi:hypothetical protein
MSFVEIAKKTGRGLALTAALFAAGSLAAAPGTAYARDWHGGGNHWGGGHWGGHHHGGGAGIGLGLLGGALAGAAIASAANPYYYPYSYSYAYSSYGYNPYGSYYPY